MSWLFQPVSDSNRKQVARKKARRVLCGFPNIGVVVQQWRTESRDNGHGKLGMNIYIYIYIYMYKVRPRD